VRDINDIIQFLTNPNYDELTGEDKGLNYKEVLNRALTLLDVNISAKRREAKELESLKERLQLRVDEII
jgi:hypothetical protein